MNESQRPAVRSSIIRPKRQGLCMCNMPEKCKQIMESFILAQESVMTNVLRISYGERTTALRACIAHHFKFSADAKKSMEDYRIAIYHWHPSLIEKYKSKPRRQFSAPISAEEADMCNVKEDINKFEACLALAGKESLLDSKNRGRFVQAPVYALNLVTQDVASLSTARGRRSLSRASIPSSHVTPLTTSLPPVVSTCAKAIVMSTPDPIASPICQASPLPAPRRIVMDTPSTPAITAHQSALPSATSVLDMPSTPAITSHQPALSVESPQVFPSVAEFHRLIQARSKKYTLSENTANEKFRCMIRTLRDYHRCFDPIEISVSESENRFLYPCFPINHGASSCSLFELRKVRAAPGVIVHCPDCKKVVHAAALHAKVKAADVDNMRTAPDSRVRIACLSPGEKDEKIRRLQAERKSLKSKIKKLKQELDSKEEEIKFSDCSDGFAAAVDNVFKMVADLKGESRSNAESYIIESLIKESASESEICAKECKEFAEYVLSSISNKAKQMAGKDKTVRFTPQQMMIAMSLFLRSRSGYSEQRELSPIVMPSPTRLKEIQSEMKLKEGLNPKKYGWFFDETVDGDVRNVAKLVVGHLIFDEMKLKSGVFWRTSDHHACGFASKYDTLDMRSILKDMLQDKETEELFGDAYEPAVYVNQWRFRSTMNVIDNAEFFFNTGSLSGDDILRQLIHVLIGYEMVGVKIYGVCCDAGGSNAGLFRLLREALRLSFWENYSDADGLVSFVNPFDPSRRVAIWNCSTHLLKAMRNQLYASWFKNGLRTFMYKGVKFGWQMMVDAFDRDAKREANGSVKETKLTHAAVLPDKYELMAVGPAKAMCHPDTINEQATHIAEQLGQLPQYIAMVSALSPAVPRTKRYLLKIDFLKKHVHLTQDSGLWSKLLVLEYTATVGSIFNETFMNKDAKITKDNIDQVTEDLKLFLEFFTEWSVENEELKKTWNRGGTKKDNDDDDGENCFLSPVTFTNLRTSIAGFLTYARFVLDLEGGPSYVPFLHSNSSVLEALFSQVRSMNRDNADRYISGLGAINTAHSIRSLENNKMYAKDQIGSIVAPDIIQSLTRRRDKEREARYNKWYENICKVGAMESTVVDKEGVMGNMEATVVGSDKANDEGATEAIESIKAIDTGRAGSMEAIVGDDNDGISRFPDAYVPRNAKTMRLFEAIKHRKLKHSFAFELLALDTCFKDYATANVFTDQESWFESLSTLAHDDAIRFDHVCRGILATLFSLFERSMYASDRSIESKYHCLLLRYLQGRCGPNVDDCINGMPTQELKIRGGVVILVVTLSRWLVNWIRDGMTAVYEQMNPNTVQNGDTTEISQENEKREVNRFFGYAVFSLRRKLADREKRAMENHWRMTENVGAMIKLVDSMRVFHNKAILDDDYMANCYSTQDQARNDGWLSLVDRQYFDFGKTLMKMIRDRVNSKQYSRRGNATIQEAADQILGDKTIESSFLNATGEPMVDTKLKKRVLDKLVKKAFHARAKAATEIYKNQKTKRHVEGTSDEAFRKSLKAKTEKNTKLEAKKLKMVMGTTTSKRKRKR